jgi:predicted transcriptional regulator
MCSILQKGINFLLSQKRSSSEVSREDKVVIPLYHQWLYFLTMVAYRTSMQIVRDLLTVTEESGMNGINVTSLLTKANLSHSRLSKFIDNLTGAGLMNKIEYDGKNTFVITTKGKQYLETYERFQSLADSFGLDL